MKQAPRAKRRVLSVFLALWLTVLAIPTAAAGQSYSWYCKRTTDHTRPRCDADMQFITQYGGYYIDPHRTDDDSDRVVYLTFDAGYENGNVARVLDTLRQEQVSGAFFVLSHLIEHDTALVRRMLDEGHLVCNHTMKHRDMSRATDEELLRELQGLEQLFLEKTGCTMPKYYRPPEGRFSEANLRAAHAAGYRTIFWSFAYADWDNDHQLPREKAKQIILDHVHNGAVLLLHPTSATNAEVLGEVIRELKAQGYRFGTLDELTAP